MAASAPPIIQATAVVRSGLTPISAAAVRFEAEPLIARPSAVNLNSANKSTVRTQATTMRPIWPWLMPAEPNKMTPSPNTEPGRTGVVPKTRATTATPRP